MANKNSLYVQSLVDFILDTKPYHSKLTEVVEEYRFFDEMTVHFEERLFSNTMMKAAWPYSYFSGGVPTGQVTSMHQLVAPNYRKQYFVFGTDENTDLPMVPGAYDPKSFDGPGIVKATFVRADGSEEPIIEGHDVHQSHGAYVFQIHQTVSTQPLVVGRFTDTYEVTDGPFPLAITLPFTNADSLVITGPATQVTLSSISVTGPGVVNVYGLSNDLPYDPLFAEKKDEAVMAHATAVAQAQALDTGNPSSAINLIDALLDEIAFQLTLFPNAAASAELAALQAIISSNNLPSSYEALLNALVNGGTPVIVGYPGWRVDLDTWAPPYNTYVDQRLAQYSTGLYFNEFTDVALREGGALRYEEVYRDDIEITNIVSDPLRAEYEEWTLEAVTPTTFLVRGSVSGVISVATLPGTFTSPQISFTLTAGVNPVAIGTEIALTPQAKITIHAEAPLEAWSLIKVNPLSYSRPLFSSDRYGYILSSTAVRDFVTVLDQTLPTGTIVLTATSSTQFTLTSSADPLYTASVTVGTAFNDGRLAFTIVAGTEYAFQPGDKFFIELLNEAPTAEDLDLYYGYDMDGYDADTVVYNTVNSLVSDYLSTIGFGWDSRFASYDLATFNLQIAQSAVPGRQWRLRALPDLGAPLPLQNSIPTNQLNLLADDDPLNPNATVLFDQPSNTTAEGPQSNIDTDASTDVQLWYANSFELEYLDGGTWTSVGTVPVGSTYSSLVHGISFTLVPSSKPFIASRLTTTQYDTLASTALETVDGGDTISWTVLNEPPVQQGPAGLSSINATHLWIHGDSYHASTPAQWSLTWVNGTQYHLQGIYTTGPMNGSNVFAPPGLLIDTAEGQSYRNDTHGLHWTLYSGLVGQAAGDTLLFETYETRPTFLVHGSVSGWQPDATIGEWYWNGKIGFKLKPPVASLFEGSVLLDTWTSSVGVVSLDSLRIDAPTAVYTIRSHTNGHWTMYRNGRVVADGATVLRDKYVQLTMPTAVLGTYLTLHVVADDHDLSLGHDLAITRTSPGRSLGVGDSLSVTRSEFDDIMLSVKPVDPAHSLTLQPLAPQTIDLRFVDLNALSGVPLSATSPEVAVLQGWIPLLQDRYDTTSSEAVYSDAQTKVVLRAAGTGETIGTVVSLDSTNPSEPVVMQWDSTFASQYMPLNTEVTVVTLGSGVDEHVFVNITEGVRFLLSGGSLSDSALFADELNVGIVEDNQWTILSEYSTDFTATVADGPFGGFLPGFGNMPYDFELGGDLTDPPDDTDPEGFYDAGQPLVDYFLRAQYLSNLMANHPHPVLTAPEADELEQLLARLDNYLVGGSLAATSLSDLIIALNVDLPVNYTPQFSSFGTPALGMAMEIDTTSAASAGTAVVESMTIVADDAAYSYDRYGFDVGELDTREESTAIVLVNNAFPLSVRAATTANHGLSGLASVDGVTLSAGDLVLVKNQTTTSQNGIYTASAGAWTRPTQYNAPSELVLGLEVQVLNGTAHAGSVWEITTAPVLVGTSPIVFNQVLTYNAFDGPLFTADPGGRVINLSLTFDYPGTPKVWIWLPDWSSPASALVEKFSNRLFRLSLPARSEFKLIAG